MKYLKNKKNVERIISLMVFFILIQI